MSVSTRRDFLRYVLLASGAVYMMGAEGCRRVAEDVTSKAVPSLRKGPVVDGQRFLLAHRYLRDGGAFPSPSRTERCDVLVVGSGMSGLAAATMLHRQGIDVRIIESEPRSGGTAVSHQGGNVTIPLGSVYFVDRTPELDALIDYAGVQPVECPGDGYIFDDVLYRDLWSDTDLGKAVRSEADRDGMRRFRDDILALGDNIPSYPLPGILNDRLRKLDNMSGRDYIRRYQSPTLDAILDAYSKSSMGAPLDATNAYCLLNFYSSEFGRSYDLGRYTFPGGTSVLAEGLARRLPVMTGRLAVRAGQEGDDAIVDTIDDEGVVVRHRARCVIMAVPKFQVPHLIPDLSAERVAACRALTYAPYATIHVASTMPLVDERIYDTWRFPMVGGYTDIIAPTTVQRGAYDQHVASLFAPIDIARRSMLQNDESFVRFAHDSVSAFEATLSEAQRNSITGVYLWRWGHGIVVPTLGSHSGIAQAVSRPEGAIFFANTDNDVSPALENAVGQGTVAAVAVLRHMARSRNKAATPNVP